MEGFCLLGETVWISGRDQTSSLIPIFNTFTSVLCSSRSNGSLGVLSGPRITTTTCHSWSSVPRVDGTSSFTRVPPYTGTSHSWTIYSFTYLLNGLLVCLLKRISREFLIVVQRPHKSHLYPTGVGFSVRLHSFSGHRSLSRKRTDLLRYEGRSP